MNNSVKKIIEAKDVLEWYDDYKLTIPKWYEG